MKQISRGRKSGAFHLSTWNVQGAERSNCRKSSLEERKSAKIESGKAAWTSSGKKKRFLTRKRFSRNEFSTCKKIGPIAFSPDAYISIGDDSLEIPASSIHGPESTTKGHWYPCSHTHVPMASLGSLMKRVSCLGIASNSRNFGLFQGL